MLTFADRLLFSARRRATRALTQGVTRLARRARAARRQLRRTCAAPSRIGESTLTRQFRWPWCGGYIGMAEAAGIRRLESSCVRWVPACEGPTHAFTSTSTPDTAALAA